MSEGLIVKLSCAVDVALTSTRPESEGRRIDKVHYGKSSLLTLEALILIDAFRKISPLIPPAKLFEVDK